MPRGDAENGRRDRRAEGEGDGDDQRVETGTAAEHVQRENESIERSVDAHHGRRAQQRARDDKRGQGPCKSARQRRQRKKDETCFLRNWNLPEVPRILERMKHPLRANTLELEQHLLSPMSVRDRRCAERMAEEARQARFKRQPLSGRDYAEKNLINFSTGGYLNLDNNLPVSTASNLEDHHIFPNDYLKKTGRMCTRAWILRLPSTAS